ncbi:hypothetical protein [Peristeroidobacter soli]|jgi:hypothetical protein|uniref:hypothetical protein n=1 Tax=Peristeroidobacter soli TaxID=2497877 RepID=UPI00101E1B92|nr:hypothetical protein [Peristeroidobacter soli]
MDNGLWASWYDIDPADETEWLAWLHDVYLPKLLQRPGIAWAAHYRNTGGGESMRELHRVAARPDEAVPEGCAFLLLVGAPSPHTFFNPHVLDMQETAEDGQRLAKRRGLRHEFYVEETRVDGCAIEHRFPGSTSAPAIQFGAYRMRTVEAELELSRWYSQQRLPLMSRMKSCVRTRKLVSVAGWAKHGVLYEFSSLADRLADHEQPHESKTLDPQAWTGKITSNAVYPPGSPFVGERIWPPVR